MSARAHLVIVLPGIGGSVLAPPGDLNQPVWQASLPSVPNLLLRPDRLSLGEREFLEPVGLIKSRKVFGVWTVIPGYQGLLSRLAGLPKAVLDDGTPSGRCLDANVVAVGYDFRRSIVEAAERLDDQIKQRLRWLWPADAEAKPRVVFIAHSMGGLVARYWAAQQQNWRLCRALITLGTPHRGAPKALEVLTNGVPVKGFHIRRPIEVLRGWPGVAELLPRYPAILDSTDGDGPVLRRPHELQIDWLRDRAAAAFNVHKRIEEGWERIPRTGPEMVARIGFGHGTLRRCRWDGTSMQVTGDAPDLGTLGGWAEDIGDGTVPAFSGMPPENDLAYAPGLRVPMRHGPIVDLDEVISLIEGYEGRPPLRHVHGQQRAVGLGVELDELALTGESIEVRARLIGIDAEITQVPVWAQVGEVDVRLEWDSDSAVFTGVLPGQMAGVRRVVIATEGVPGGGDLEVEQLIEVIDDDGLE